MRCLKTSSTQGIEDSEDVEEKICHLLRLATMCVGGDFSGLFQQLVGIVLSFNMAGKYQPCFIMILLILLYVYP